MSEITSNLSEVPHSFSYMMCISFFTSSIMYGFMLLNVPRSTFFLNALWSCSCSSIRSRSDLGFSGSNLIAMSTSLLGCCSSLAYEPKIAMKVTSFFMQISASFSGSPLRLSPLGNLSASISMLGI